jgi:hypothetical protein
MAASSLSDLFRLAAPAWLAVCALSCGGKDEDESGPESTGSAGVQSLPLNPCLSELRELGYEFAENPPYANDFEIGMASRFDADNDRTPGSTQDPAPDDSVRPTELPEPRCPDDPEPSTLALRIRATGLRDWGGVVGKRFDPDNFDGNGADADDVEDDWHGLSFWARRGAGSPGRTMFAAISEYHTHEKCPFCDPDGEPVSEACDRFGVGVGLQTDWRFYAIPFASMRQQGYGKPAECLDQDDIIGFGFYFGSGDWDIWIDDIRFYRAPPDAVPPGASVTVQDGGYMCDPGDDSLYAACSQ